MSLTSYTHEPFYKPFVIEVQDNWRWAPSYNLPLNDLMEVMESAVRNGYTFAWGADVSEDGFSRRTGKHRCVATVPDTKSTAGVGSDQSRWTGEQAGGQDQRHRQQGRKDHHAGDAPTRLRQLGNGPTITVCRSTVWPKTRTARSIS